ATDSHGGGIPRDFRSRTAAAGGSRTRPAASGVTVHRHSICNRFVRDSDCGPNGQGGGMRVLIAEDEPVSRQLLDNTIRGLGFEVTATQDGQAAWEVLHSPQPPRLAVVDWQMPGMDGLELCRRLREDEATKSVYVVLLTGRGGVENR